MKYFIIAGEASGDLHASNLIISLKKLDPDADFEFLGGDLMQKAAKHTPVIHYKRMAFMGFADVLMNIRTILGNFKKAKKALLEYHPDVVILVDYPGFNLKMAAFAKKNDFKTHYYISPKLWAWKEWRVKKIRKYVDKLFVILPFEIPFYNKHNIKAEYVGNPVVDAVMNYRGMGRNAFLQAFNLSNKPIIALLPGSRKQELKMMLPGLLSVAKQFRDYQFVISGAPGLTKADYEAYVQGVDIPIIFDHTYDLLQIAHSALVTSGTATLETALFKVPQVVVYKTYNWQYYLGKLFVKIPYFSLVNLILNKPAVTELLQYDFNPSVLKMELESINQGKKRTKLLQDYQELSELLGNNSASDKTVALILADLNAKG